MNNVQLTTAGLLEATSAALQGVRLQITNFKIGAGVAYTPDPGGAETGLRGALLYSAPITSYTEQTGGGLILSCTIDSQAGPWSFGEIGIFLASGTMLGSLALPVLQPKYTALSGGIVSTFTFDLYLKLSQGTAVFQVATSGSEIDTAVAAAVTAQLPTSTIDWAPVLQGETNPGIGSYLYAQGRIQTVGKLAFLSAHLQCVSHTGTGPMSMLLPPGITVYNPGQIYAAVPAITNSGVLFPRSVGSLTLDNFPTAISGTPFSSVLAPKTAPNAEPFFAPRVIFGTTSSPGFTTRIAIVSGVFNITTNITFEIL